MRYDADIIIIGAGPAGLAAAMRARWVKSSEMVPASVLLLDPAGPGGIAALGTVFLVGPAWNFQGDLPSRHLFGDLRQMEIPVLREAAVGVEHDGDLWTVHTPARDYRSLAVVLATGLRQLTDEPRLRAEKALTFLSGGYERAADRFMSWSDEHAEQRLVIIGGAELAEAMPQFRAYDRGRNQLTAIYEPAQRVLGYTSEDGLITLTIETRGRRQQFPCEHVMLDYHSLEQAPPSLHFLPPAWRTLQGYSRIGPAGDPAIPGLFAAGDCAGTPSMCVKALAQGAEAGFHAYRHVYTRKFGDAPYLFAFFPASSRPPLDVREFPIIDPARHRPVGLTAASAFPRLLEDGETALTPEQLEILAAEMRHGTATVHLC
jgi:thioredoxin reductase (NADPH)